MTYPKRHDHMATVCLIKLESAIIKHPAVLEVAVIPNFDVIKGAIPKAFIVLREGFNPSAKLSKEILASSNDALSFYEYIRIIEFCETLPKTISGKIKHFELKEQESNKGNTLKSNDSQLSNSHKFHK